MLYDNSSMAANLVAYLSLLTVTLVKRTIFYPALNEVAGFCASPSNFSLLSYILSWKTTQLYNINMTMQYTFLLSSMPC